VHNYIEGRWRESSATETVPVLNPATGEELGRTPLSPAAEIDAAAQAAARAFPQWRRVPVTDRIQYLFKLKARLEDQFDDLARTITMEAGKTLAESRGELRRAIENVEVACGAPMLIQGYNSEDIAAGIDEMMVRQPLGVTAIIAPFNFPGMIPFWFLPYAIAAGNTVVIKPSERVPLTMQKVFRLLDDLKLPPGIVNLVNGGRDAVNAILDHPVIRSVSFVGSSAIARHVYSRGAAAGKRVQCQGGAKNPVIVMPDADMSSASEIIADSAFGCAGQRCLASSFAVAVGDASRSFTEAIQQRAAGRVTGYGLDEGVQMGPVISAESRSRIESLIDRAIREGARPLVDGRRPDIPKYGGGYFVRPTVLEGLPLQSDVAQTCLFTTSGASARKFRYEAEVGNVGINVGVAAPMAFFPFSGARESFFGDLHGQGRDAFEFFTQEKVVVERWPRDWTRKF
jgi:malonate-semialdehyde dehydrogenase (acetylating)/methylmalonate-semialdehyde dehydrogenase